MANRPPIIGKNTHVCDAKGEEDEDDDDTALDENGDTVFIFI
jgi:hypothetical protein